jgi:hypothetical protein
MSTNVGTIDRALRLIVGLALIAWALGWIGPVTSWNWIGWIGIVAVGTALLGTCPAYTLLGVSTCPAPKR